MGSQRSLLNICSMMGNYRTFLLGRPASVALQQTAGLKQSLEAKLGLPQKPKRPLTPYFRFLNKVRPTLIKNNPDAKVTDIAKLAGAEWEKLGVTSKQELEAAYRKEVAVYEQALQKYKNNLSEEDVAKINSARQDIVEQREKAKMRMRLKELGKPKRPMTSFFMFLNEKMTTRGAMPLQEWRSKVLQQWHGLSDKEKEVYTKKQAANQETYKRELRQWEERMIRMGNIDVVRNEALIETRPVKKKQTKASKTQ